MGWHAAVVYAIVGEVPPGVEAAEPQDGRPDPELIAAALRGRDGGLERVRAEIAARHQAGEPWPHPIPAQLRDGLGAAQLFALIADLRRRLDLDPPVRPVLSDRPLTADERRLLADVPPHHGH